MLRALIALGCAAVLCAAIATGSREPALAVSLGDIAFFSLTALCVAAFFERHDERS